MRPNVLTELYSDITRLSGVGPRTGAIFEQFIGSRLIDIVFHLPYQVVDRSARPPLTIQAAGNIITSEVSVLKHVKPRNRNQPYRINCANDTGTLDLVFFRAREDWLQKTLPIGSSRIVSGRVEQYRDSLQMVHPDYMLPVEKAHEMPVLEPVYPLTASLTGNMMRKAVQGACSFIPKLEEWQQSDWLKKMQWPSWQQALLELHNPTDPEVLETGSPQRERLAYDELLANQVTLSLIRSNRRVLPGIPLPGTGEMVAKFRSILPYTLTNAQQAAIADIRQDLIEPKRMLRLVQGDVGSGKTFVALEAMLQTTESDKQATLMAPTEILARQHAASIGPYLDQLGISWDILTGRNKGKARQAILEKLSSGETKILIGTHALFQDDVMFNDLGLAIVDEQHRFGVQQRIALSDKGKDRGQSTNILILTATPIPRTLTLVAYGDMDVSKITEKPPGRKPIETHVMSMDRYAEVKASLARLLSRGERAYWVCPLVAESELIDLTTAEERFADLKETYGDQVGLVHGQMPNAEKDRVMEAFKTGEISVLVATTVIEVGVDVPEATGMIIEHAERFGLAQLHQLRGRVGRGDSASNCLLLYRGPLGEIAKARLNIMRETQDGFRIAEEDLRLRGSGEVLGLRQSGLPNFRLANLDEHAHLLPAVHDDARLILQEDPTLTSSRGQAIRLVLNLFERTEALRFLKAG
ncbi:ATP-dependent DNA helicase RecG [Alphaproteobacteria bacterium]|nr:ATP-dependent DNA helicase RecG [Alphaproteobacteria bacterium]